MVSTAEISTVICDKPEKAKVLLGNVESQETPGLKRILLMDVFESQLVEKGESCGVQVHALKDVEVNKPSDSHCCFTLLLSLTDVSANQSVFGGRSVFIGNVTHLWWWKRC